MSLDQTNSPSKATPGAFQQPVDAEFFADPQRTEPGYYRARPRHGPRGSAVLASAVWHLLA